MEVIFLQDVIGQARAGEINRVSDGYARNYLIPKGLATLVTPEIMKRRQKIQVAGNDKRARETQVMQELAEILNGTTITVAARVTPNGRYYGAISATRIADELSKALDREFDRRLVDIIEPIREPGEYKVPLNLGSNVEAVIHIQAEAEA